LHLVTGPSVTHDRTQNHLGTCSYCERDIITLEMLGQIQFKMHGFNEPIRPYDLCRVFRKSLISLDTSATVIADIQPMKMKRLTKNIKSDEREKPLNKGGESPRIEKLLKEKGEGIGVETAPPRQAKRDFYQIDRTGQATGQDRAGRRDSEFQRRDHEELPIHK
jgi:hypothetical protein